MVRVYSASALAVGGLLLVGTAEAQTIAPQTGTQVTQTGSQYDITGGAVSVDGQNLFHGFDQFGLAAGELANFVAEPGVLNVLARVSGGDASVINGVLQVSGTQANLYLLNPAGVLLGPNVVLNLPGSLTVTTADGIGFNGGSFDAVGGGVGLGGYAALTGSPQSLLFRTETAGAVVNAGDLQLGTGQTLVLAGGSVLNTGSVETAGGRVAIAAVPGSNRVRLSPTGAILSYEVTPTAAAAITPLSLPALLTGSGLGTGTEISPDGTVRVAGTAVPAASAIASGRIDVSIDVSAGGAAGEIAVLGETVGILNGQLVATGTSGGQIYLGGSRTGSGPLPNAEVTYVDASSVVSASGQTGGEVVVWGTQVARVDGHLLATGSQRGGFVETSSQGDLSIAIAPNVSAAGGTPGLWLIDPLNISITTANNSVTGASPFQPTGAGATIAAATLESALQGGSSVTVTTVGTAGSEPGNITVEERIDLGGVPTPVSLILEAAGSIFVNAPIAPNTTPIEAVNLSLIAGVGTNSGQVVVRNLGGFFAVLDSNGGNVEIRANSTSLTGVADPSAIIFEDGVFVTTTTFNEGSPDGNLILEGVASSGAGINLRPSAFVSVGDGSIVMTGSGPETGISIAEDLFAGGGITLTSNSGDIVVETLGATGNVTVNTARFFRAIGEREVFGESESPLFSYSVLSRGGDVTITHRGNGIVPFDVGSAVTNGTLSSIRTATEAIAPTQSFPSTYTQGNIQIITSVPEPVPPSVPPPVPPTVTLPNCTIDCQPRPTFSPSPPRVRGSAGTSTPPLLVTRSSDGDALTSLTERERTYTDAFAGYLGIEDDSPQPDLPALQENLTQVAEATGIRPAILYISFIPASPASDLAAESNEADPALQARAKSAAQTETEETAQTLQNQDVLELILVTADGPPLRKTVFVTKAELDRTVGQFRSEVSNRSRLRGRTYLAAAQQLYGWMVAPLSAELTEANIGNIAFVMPPGLRSLPVSALHDGEGFLIERYSVGLMPSVSLTDLRYVDVRNSEVLAMGASNFTDQPALPAVPIELRAITERIWPGEFLLNETFTPDLLVASRQQTPYGIVHLATHGEFKSGSVDNSYIQFWDRRVGLDQVRALQLNNPPVELMVLSACRTALGNEEAELGFAGMAVQAGVKTALASLWRVDDVGTAGLMTQFYSQLRDDPIKAEALRQAQLAMLNGEIRVANNTLFWSGGEIELPPDLANIDSNTFRHPFFWASFTIIGSPW